MNNNIVDKILGQSPKSNFNCDNAFNKGGIGFKGLGKGLGFGQGNGPVQRGHMQNFDGGNLNINPHRVVAEIQKLLDKLPEVKNAKGSLNVTFIDGKKSTLNLSYN